VSGLSKKNGLRKLKKEFGPTRPKLGSTRGPNPGTEVEQFLKFSRNEEVKANNERVDNREYESRPPY
jgi:hypothetical protein